MRVALKGVTPLELSSLPGQTDTMLPIWDTVDTPYLSSMEIPIDEKDFDRLASNVDASEEVEESSRHSLLEVVGHYLWDVIEIELTPKQFQIFYLYYMHNFTQGQIAKILQLHGGQAVVAQMLHISETRLRKRLGDSFVSILHIA